MKTDAEKMQSSDVLEQTRGHETSTERTGKAEYTDANLTGGKTEGGKWSYLPWTACCTSPVKEKQASQPRGGVAEGHAVRFRSSDRGVNFIRVLYALELNCTTM